MAGRAAGKSKLAAARPRTGQHRAPTEQLLGPGDLSAWLGIGAERIRQLAVEGVFTRLGRGQYPLRPTVRAYIDWLKDEQRRANKTDDEDQVALERARKLRLENDETERLTVRTEDAIAALDAIVGPVKADFASIGARVTDDIALRRKFEDAVDAVLDGLARRFSKAAADLREGRDALAADGADEPDRVGEEE